MVTHIADYLFAGMNNFDIAKATRDQRLISLIKYAVRFTLGSEMMYSSNSVIHGVFGLRYDLKFKAQNYIHELKGGFNRALMAISALANS